MMKPMPAAHTPALTLSEAAMLPAQPGNLVMPRRDADFVPMNTPMEAAQTAESASQIPSEAAATARPGRLMMPRREGDFIPVEAVVPGAGITGQARRGSAAGRAILYAQGVSLPGVGAMSRGR